MDDQEIALDDEELFALYCIHAGSIDGMVEYIATLPLEKRVAYPSRATLFRRADKHQWRGRYLSIRKGILKHEEEKNAATYERINKVADLAITGLMIRLVEAIQTKDPKKMEVFTAELLHTVWKIHRTERGLGTSVSAGQQQSLEYLQNEHYNRRLDELGYGDVAEAVSKLTPEGAAVILKGLGIKETIPPILLDEDPAKQNHATSESLGN